jgi:pyridinium-3,5-biscarboxylic acid mononucleotide synthase
MSGAPMNLSETNIRELLERVAAGGCGVEDAIARLRSLPFEVCGSASIDTHRNLRTGFAEVVLCGPKTPAQVAEIFARLAGHHDQVLGTRATPEQFQAARTAVGELQYNELGKVIWLDRAPQREKLPGIVLITAGTADMPVAEEAAMTLEVMGHSPCRFNDVGVAGWHRLLVHVKEIQSANVIIVIAGMEGALPSVVAGLASSPVIAVPTSVGYGASFGGIAALLGMLNSCAAGVSVVNIDNGFGAAWAAAMINRMAHKHARAGHGGST